MKIAFLHVVDDSKFKYTENDHRFVSLMVESARKTMPNTDIIHLTDNSTKSIEGTITVRKPFIHDNPMLFRMEHIS